MKKPTILTDEQMRPGMEVEKHLREFGHLPEDGCCPTPEESVEEIVRLIVEMKVHGDEELEEDVRAIIQTERQKREEVVEEYTLAINNAVKDLEYLVLMTPISQRGLITKNIETISKHLKEALTQAHQAGIDEGVMEENNRIREEYELLAGENPTMSYDKIFKKAIKR